MLTGAWVEAVALVAAFVVAVITTPGRGVRAVLLLPFQVSVLGTPSPSVTLIGSIIVLAASARPGS